MSGPIHSVPAELKTFEEPSCLLPGESRREFEMIRRMIIEDISPKTNMEWLWILDLTELSWEILRYRRLKEKTLRIYRANAIAAILQRLDGAGMPEQSRMFVQSRSERTAAEWCEDADAAFEIESRLERNGFDISAINAEVFLQARVPFTLFDQLMQSAQHRRNTLLREIAIRREFERRGLHSKGVLQAGDAARCAKPAKQPTGNSPQTPDQSRTTRK